MNIALTPKRASGFAIVESIIAVALLAIVVSSTLFALGSSNRFVVSQRYVSNAKALCQERVDEALVQPFTPPAVPAFMGTWPLPTTEPVTPTFTEPAVPIYTMADSGATALVTGARKTWVTRYTPNNADPLFFFVRVRVRVEFLVNGRGINNKLWSPGDTKFFYEMTTLRAPD